VKVTKHLVISTISAFVLSVFLTAPAAAQEAFEGAPSPQTPQQAPQIEVSESDLDQFARAMAAVQEIQLQAQERIEAQIGESELEELRFQEIHSAALNPQIEMPEDISDAEQEAYEELLDGLVRLEQEAQRDMQNVVQSEGLEVNRFNEIATAVQQDQELFSELQARME